MFSRYARTWLFLSCLGGCHSTTPVADHNDRAAADQVRSAREEQTVSCQQNTISAYGGRVDPAKETTSSILLASARMAEPKRDSNHVSLAASLLEKGDQTGACEQLLLYLKANPEHMIVRGQLAELLLRLDRSSEARLQFEIFDAQAQDQGDVLSSQIIHCHSRLTRIAESEQDEYGRHLHRGIGLFLLAQEVEALHADEGRLTTEGLLCKAARDLLKAQRLRPEEARPSWYLYEVRSHLAQRQAALTWLHEANSSSPYSFLTPAEHRNLKIACLSEKKTR